MAYDFPNSHSVGQIYNGYIWDGEKWLTSGAPGPVVAYRKNYIVNGAMQISQENGSTPVTISSMYPVDQFGIGVVTSGGVWNAAQVASTSPAGSPNRLRVTVTTADTTIVAGDVCYLFTHIEGLRAADLFFGTSSAKTVTVRFGVKAPAGTYSVVIANGNVSRSYVAEYVIAAGEANTDVVKSVTVPGDVTGTWAKDNTNGMIVRWGLMCGTTYAQAPGVWGTTVGTAASTNQSNLFAANGNVFELFDVSLVEGPVAPPFTVPDYVTELALCRRYYWDFRDFGKIAGHCTNATLVYGILYHPGMRAVPTITSPGTFVAWTANTGSATVTTNPGTYIGGFDQSMLQWTCSGGGLVAGNISYLVGNNGRMMANARM